MRRDARAWGASIVVVMIAGSALASCGGQDAGDARTQIEAEVRAVDSAFASGDLQRACEGMTQRAKLLVGSMAHNDPGECTTDLRRVRGWMTDESLDLPAIEVVHVKVDGRHATATVRQADSAPYAVRMAKQGEGWKLDGVFDAGASQVLQSDSHVRPDSGPGPKPVSRPAAPVEASTPGDDASPCPRTATRRSAGNGRCTIRFDRELLRMTVRSVFGDVPLATCEVGLTLHVAADGSTFANDFVAHVNRKPCGDILGCGIRPSVTRHRPWVGRVERQSDGDLRLRVANACLDTCMGVYRGDVVFAIERRAGSWRLRADRSMIGASGFVLDGDLDARPTPIAFSRNHSR